MQRTSFFACTALVIASTAVSGQTSPYADHADREIKALSAEQIDGLLAGEGMGLALAAELNGYPGPKHVLELAAELGRLQTTLRYTHLAAHLETKALLTDTQLSRYVHLRGYASEGHHHGSHTSHP